MTTPILKTVQRDSKGRPTSVLEMEATPTAMAGLIVDALNQRDLRVAQAAAQAAVDAATRDIVAAHAKAWAQAGANAAVADLRKRGLLREAPAEAVSRRRRVGFHDGDEA
jgi:hypothetical protein